MKSAKRGAGADPSVPLILVVPPLMIPVTAIQPISFVTVSGVQTRHAPVVVA